MTSSAERVPARTRLAFRASPRTELAAGAAVAALLAHLLLAQLTLVFLICFMIIGALSRWRPLWLVAPAAAGWSWVLMIGFRPAMAGYTAGGAQVISYLTGPGPALARLAHLPVAFSDWPSWLPQQFPLALIAATVETAGLAVLGHVGRPERYRPGLVIAVRRRYLAATIRRGEVATSDGGCVGLATRTGRRAAISWREAECGVLCAGTDAAAVSATGLELAVAAIQHRKAVIIIDSVGSAGLAESIAHACAQAGAPLRRYGDHGGGYGDHAARTHGGHAARTHGGHAARTYGGHAARTYGCYQPLPGADPAGAASLIVAMIDWGRVSQAQRRFCADYLDAALIVLAASQDASPDDGQDASPGDGPDDGTAASRAAGAAAWLVGEPVADLDELTGLLHPDALRARLRQAPGDLAGRAALARQVDDLARQFEADPAAITPLATQLTGLRSAALGHWLRPARSDRRGHAADRMALAGPAQPTQRRLMTSGETQISLGQALADREVVLFPLDRRVHGRSAAMIARLVAADLISKLAQASAQSVPGDCLVWINGCEVLDPRQITALIALGSGTGTAVLLGTVAEPVAARIAPEVNVIVVRGPALPAVASLVEAADQGSTGPPADWLLGQRPEALSLLVRSPQRLLLRCRAVR
jgi:hypothetical protein